ncbi:MAG: hypothetical protein A3B14_00180 [Candidatus Zambryskibacteria bacterium RIFCSPLOWO2_01_FULL_45_21]|uniref:STAS/SEC14 domain-containing protein n=1 Tax=Candidatus Zambryskibacteria bacterium RIFCSPLOWO2_01_FULL_45_21 TaxID=1802761 RepID=A0A1G2U0M1_9BACT|nr:MAG: hypothetical protein A3B14_00180 [Candidatus Zambryskibacteria bacterium RIFCSPLOWO2_01_FULL_45_21]
MSKDDKNLDIKVGAGNILNLTIAGDISGSNMAKLTEWIQEVKQSILDLHKKTGDRVLCLVDITGLEKYDPEAITILADMMKENEPHIKKTATFGGSKYVVLAEDVVVALSGRKNLKGFEKKEKALAWLNGEDEAAEADPEVEL